MAQNHKITWYVYTYTVYWYKILSNYWKYISESFLAKYLSIKTTDLVFFRSTTVTTGQ